MKLIQGITSALKRLEKRPWYMKRKWMTIQELSSPQRRNK